MSERIAPKHRNNTVEFDPEVKAAIDALYTPWFALELFNDPALTNESRQEVLSATKEELLHRINSIGENTTKDYLIVIDFMEKAMVPSVFSEKPAHVDYAVPLERVDPQREARITGRIALNLIGMPKELANA